MKTLKELIEVVFCAWHQNYNDEIRYKTIPILDCRTVEEVIVELKACQDGDSAYSDFFEDDLTTALTELGMAESEPAPDEESDDIR